MSSRSAVGRIWLQLVVRHYCACRNGDEEARQKIFDIIDTLSELYPEAIEAEVKTFVAEIAERGEG